jgi:methionyl-tRNA synthetase
MALELPLPQQIFAHGHLLHHGQKLSKSSGIVIEPVQLMELFGVERLRYYLQKAFNDNAAVEEYLQYVRDLLEKYADGKNVETKIVG